MGKMSIHAGSGPCGHLISTSSSVLCNLGGWALASYISQVLLRAGFQLPQSVEVLPAQSRGRPKERTSCFVSLSSTPSPFPPTCLRWFLYLKVHLFHGFSFDWRGLLWFQLPSSDADPSLFAHPAW